MIFDLRSIDKNSLDKLDSEFIQLIEKMKSEKINIDIKVLGERPAVKCSEAGRLIKIINEVREELKLNSQFTSGSSNANIAMSMNIPAVSFGIYQGKGSHTMKEYIDVNSLELGLGHLVEIVLKLINS